MKLSAVSLFLRDCLACVMYLLMILAPKVHTFVSASLSHHKKIYDVLAENINITASAESKESLLVIWKVYWLVRNSYLGPCTDVSETLPTAEVYTAAHLVLLL